MTLRASIPLAPVAAAVTALALSACGGSSGAPATTAASAPATTSTHTVTHVVSPKTTTSAPTSAAATTGAQTSAAASGPPAGCTPTDLGIRLGPSSGAAGTEYVQYDFVNVTSHACTLMGYPGVSLVLTDGHVDDITNNRDPGDKSHLVTVPAGGDAAFTVGFVSSAAHPCVNATHLRFIPPNDYAYEQIADKVQACGRFVDVTPVGYGVG